MNIFLKIFETMILAPLKHCFDPWCVHFLALTAKCLRVCDQETPQMAYKIYITTLDGYIWIYRTSKLIFFSQYDKNPDFGLLNPIFDPSWYIF